MERFKSYLKQLDEELKLLQLSDKSHFEYIEKEKHLMAIINQLKYSLFREEFERSKVELTKVKMAYNRAVDFITKVTGMTETEIRYLIEKGL